MAKKVQLRRIEGRTWAFQLAINQGRTSPLTSQKWGPYNQIWRFSHKCQKTIKSQKSDVTEFRCLKTYGGRVVARSTTYRMISTFWQGMTPLP